MEVGEKGGQGGRERKVGVMEKPAMDVGEETRGTKRGGEIQLPTATRIKK